MNKLYPLKFTPIYKHKIWGGKKLREVLKKQVEGNDVGESWEISGVQDNLSVVSNGYLKGNNLQELIEVYMGELVGDSVYEKFGIEFPLLIKFIDANDVLSVQVHPNDKMAKERHHSYGKTEMWYVVQADEGGNLIAGFNRPITKEEYVKLVEKKQLEEVLNTEQVSQGDCFFMPSGKVHAIGKGVLVAEIQQTSDITYRIFDWNRVDSEGKARELHTDLAVDAIDFTYSEENRTPYKTEENQSAKMVECPYFTTNVLEISQNIDKDYTDLDSFVVYMCAEGKATIEVAGEQYSLQKGETILIPAGVERLRILPGENSRLLEVYIK